MLRVMNPVFAMEESSFLDGGSRLDDVDLRSLASVSEWRSVAYLPTNVPDVGRCLTECEPAPRAQVFLARC